MRHYIDILRPSVCVLSSFGVIVGALISGVSDAKIILFGMLAAFFISAGGNVSNDIFDYNIDKINKPEKPLPSRKISIKIAVLYSAILFLIGIFFSILTNSWFLLLALFNTFFILLYNRYLKRTIVGHFAESWLPVSTFLAGSFLSKTLNPVIFLLCSMAYFSNAGREIVKGIEDIKGDKKSGLKTPAVVFGKNFSSIIAIMLILLAVLISPVPYTLGIFSIEYLYVVILSDILFGISLFLIPFPEKSQKLMKIAMYVGIFAFLIGTLY